MPFVFDSFHFAWDIGIFGMHSLYFCRMVNMAATSLYDDFGLHAIFMDGSQVFVLYGQVLCFALDILDGTPCLQVNAKSTFMVSPLRLAPFAFNRTNCEWHAVCLYIHVHICVYIYVFCFCKQQFCPM